MTSGFAPRCRGERWRRARWQRARATTADASGRPPGRRRRRGGQEASRLMARRGYTAVFRARGDFTDLMGRAHMAAQGVCLELCLSREGCPRLSSRAFLCKEHHVALHLHVRIRVRRTSRQSLRLHLRLDPRRVPRAGPDQPRRVRDAVQERHGGARRRDHDERQARLRAGSSARRSRRSATPTRPSRSATRR